MTKNDAAAILEGENRGPGRPAALRMSPTDVVHCPCWAAASNAFDRADRRRPVRLPKNDISVPNDLGQPREPREAQLAGTDR